MTIEQIIHNTLSKFKALNKFSPMRRFLLVFFQILFLWIHVNAQETPKIISYNRDVYKANHQNWKITSDCNGLLFVANSDGVLIFNGFNWQLIYLPNFRKARSVFTGKDCRVYVGGYETFGFIDITDRSNPRFVSLADSILKDSSQEIWNIYGDDEKVIFQTFGTLYEYDFSTIKVRVPPSNIMFGNVIHDQNILPKGEGGLFRVLEDSIVTIDESLKLPPESKVAAISEGWSENEILIGTQYHGLFILKDDHLTKVNKEVNDLLSIEQINRIHKLKNGLVAIGTILNGLYILDSNFDVLYHINKSNGLSNNTVLSLFESEDGNLWIGLDKGINLLKVSDPINYYYDIKGQLGTFYCHAYFNDTYFIGTNQGVFQQSDNYNYNLVPGLQGQAWCLRQINNQLFCGNNSGTFIIDKEKINNIYSSTGVWWIEKIDKNKIIQATYTGLSIMELKDDKWETIPLFDTLGIIMQRFLLKNNKIFGYNPQNQAIILELNEDHHNIKEVTYYNKLDDAAITSNLYFFPLGDSVYAAMDDLVFSTKEGDFKKIKDQKRLAKIQESPNYISYLISQKIGESVPRFYDYHISNDNYLLGINEGFVSVPHNYQINTDLEDSIYIDFLQINGHNTTIEDQKNLELSYSENNLLIQLGIKAIPDRFDAFEYQLENWQSQWFPLQQNGLIEFYNLPSNNYALKVRNILTGHSVKFHTIVINPIWYKTWKGYLLLLICVYGILKFISKRHEKKLQNEKEKLRNEKLDELESERIKSRTERLERELTHKRKMLANSAMTIAQKNKMLNKLKSFVQKISISEQNSTKTKQKLLHLIEMNLASDHEWEIFEQNFAEVHDDFLDNLSKNYPELTTGDLRLAAYIKMGLSSKEISPLLNISVRSVENKRYRLRKKMNLSGEDNLSEQLMRY